MASNYVNQSNAFRQPNLADTYISLIVEALIASGSPYTVPRTTADIVNYITTTYPLFPISAVFLDTQLERAVKLSSQQLESGRLTGVQDIAWALINSSAFLFNR